MITGYNRGSESVEYYLDRQFNTLSATLFIMNWAVTTSLGHHFQWDNAEVCIYGDEALLYKKTGFYQFAGEGTSDGITYIPMKKGE